MLSACQHDARLRVSTQRVVAVEPRDDGDHDVILDDTILYAEGGGQPADHGHIDDAWVSDVQKGADGRPRHRMARPPAPGATVQVTVDWARRWDHMQQHTGQHLLSALLEDRLGLATVGFHLGTEDCSIDLDGTLDQEGAETIEDAANQAILDNREVRLRTVHADELAGLEVRSRGLPDSATGPVRLVEIAGLDTNTCGGTHVDRTGALQLVHLVRRERVRGATRLRFLVGGRALARLRSLAAESEAMTALLRSAPATHVDRVGALLDEQRAERKQRQALERRLAALVAESLARDPGPVLVHHDPTADLGALRALAGAVIGTGDTSADPRLLLAVGDGAFLLRGPPALVAAAGPGVADVLGGRGGGRGDTFQGRAAPIDPPALAAARTLLEAQLGTP